MSGDVTYVLEDGIATITINRPEFSNALSKDLYGELKDYFEQCGEDDTVRAVVLTGAGKHFSAGGDIKRFKRLIETEEYLREDNVSQAGAMGAAIRRCPKPTIAMVNGTAAGAGCSIALACDFRVVSPSSRFVMAFIKMGLSGDTGGIFYLTKLVGVGKATEMLMLGTPVDGKEALRLGLASRMAEHDDALQAEAHRLAAKLAASPLQAIQRQKALINTFFYQELEAFTRQEVAYMVECSQTEDFKEAVYAFLEKRPPNFRGQ